MHRFKLADTAVILIDHQVGTNTWAATTPLELLRRNVQILAKFAVGTGMPLVLTSSQETNVDVQGPLMPELEVIAPQASPRACGAPVWSMPGTMRPSPRPVGRPGGAIS